MPDRPRIVTFDLDAESLGSLRRAFPAWAIEAHSGDEADSPGCGTADLLVVGVPDEEAGVAERCRRLRGQLGPADTPILVLVPPGRESLVRHALEAGADSCLILPVHPKELANRQARAREGNRPGRHTLDLDRAQQTDEWRDEGGEC